MLLEAYHTPLYPCMRACVHKLREAPKVDGVEDEWPHILLEHAFRHVLRDTFRNMFRHVFWHVFTQVHEHARHRRVRRLL